MYDRLLIDRSSRVTADACYLKTVKPPDSLLVVDTERTKAQTEAYHIYTGATAEATFSGRTSSEGRNFFCFDVAYIVAHI